MQTPITQLMDGASVDPLALRRSDSPAAAVTKDAGFQGQEARAAKESPATAELVAHARQANRDLARLDSRLQFRVDDESGKVVVAVVDADTSEVLRQIPSEEMLVVSRRLQEQLTTEADVTGVLLDDSV